jgi:hypothetical protein
MARLQPKVSNTANGTAFKLTTCAVAQRHRTQDLDAVCEIYAEDHLELTLVKI